MIYNINKGETDWRPRDGFKLVKNFGEITWSCAPNQSMEFDYIDPVTDKVDKDWRDWKKMGGISLVNFYNFWNIWTKNRDAIMMGWRWNPELLVHEFCLYVNDGGSNIPYERADQLLRVKSGEHVCMTIRRTGKYTYEIYLYTKEEGIDAVNSIHVRSRFGAELYSLILLWYGGANNAPGEWGGAAPKDMTVEVDYTIK